MATNVDDTEQCPVCFEDYSADGRHVPLLLPCTHTLCRTCKQELVARHPQGLLVCPLDNARYLGDHVVPENRYILKNLRKEGRGSQVPRREPGDGETDAVRERNGQQKSQKEAGNHEKKGEKQKEPGEENGRSERRGQQGTQKDPGEGGAGSGEGREAQRPHVVTETEVVVIGEQVNPIVSSELGQPQAGGGWGGGKLSLEHKRTQLIHESNICG